MSATRPRSRLPSLTLIGALLGVGCSLLIPPRMMLSAEGRVAWLIAWSLSGLVAGAVAETVVAFARRRPG